MLDLFKKFNQWGRVRNATEIAGVFFEIYSKKEGREKRKEYFWVMSLNEAFDVLAVDLVAFGNPEKIPIDIRDVFAPAIRERASYIVICHNHPSNWTDPSLEDEELTQKIKLAGEILKIPLLDHIIITESGFFYSFKNCKKI